MWILFVLTIVFSIINCFCVSISVITDDDDVKVVFGAGVVIFTLLNAIFGFILVGNMIGAIQALQ